MNGGKDYMNKNKKVVAKCSICNIDFSTVKELIEHTSTINALYYLDEIENPK